MMCKEIKIVSCEEGFWYEHLVGQWRGIAMIEEESWMDWAIAKDLISIRGRTPKLAYIDLETNRKIQLKDCHDRDQVRDTFLEGILDGV